MIEKYYEEELRYLYESGKEFAAAHPDRARFLNIDSVGDRDPYVERLFEGFAFLSARIREKIDDSFPELTEGLVSLLWPGFLAEIPSVSIVELRPRRGLLQETRRIDRGVEILSAPVGPESATCRFTTTQAVSLNPVSLANVDRSVDLKGRETLSLDFKVDPGVNWQRLCLDPVRLYLHAEMPTAMMLHAFLTRRVVQASVSIDGGTQVRAVDPAGAVTPGGMLQSESLLPGDSRSFWGYMLLLEYFACPEKFLFADLHGLNSFAGLEKAPQRITCHLTFDTVFPAGKPFSRDNFKLHCTPAVNLFKHDADPVIYSGKETEYHVQADSTYPQSVRIHSITAVTGIDRVTSRRTEYAPFHSFNALGRKNVRTYAVHHRTGFKGRREVFLSIGGDQLTDGTLCEETLSLEAWCTNGILPREELGDASLTRPGAGLPDYVMAGNITRPALPCSPPSSGEHLWTFLSHLGANLSSLASADTLKAFLRLYDWSRSEGRRRRIEAITDVQAAPVEESAGGGVLRGTEFTVSLDDSAFEDTGDLHLFGEVLQAVLAQYVTINSFLRLVLVCKPSGNRLRWDPFRGVKWVI